MVKKTDYILKDPERFFSKIEKTETCWVWKRSKDKCGYGKLTNMNVSLFAHRLSYIIHKGEIPEGFYVDHMCRNRACVNPEHLRVVDPGTNALENSRAPGAFNRFKTICLRGHNLEGYNLIVTKTGKRACRTCLSMHYKKYHPKKVIE